MAAVLPLAASNLPDKKIIIDKYQIGATFDTGSPQNIARAIDYILSDHKRVNRMRENALVAAKHYTWENESQKLLDIYRKLAHG